MTSLSKAARPPRPGKSLVELVVVMAILSTVMLMVGRVMVGLFRAEDHATRSLLTGRTLDRLGSRLRDDVRAATGVALEERAEGPAAARLEAADGTAIEYAPSAEGVERVVRSGDAITARDVYRLHRRSAGFEFVDRPGGRMLRLTVRPTRPAEPTGAEAASANPLVWRTDVRVPGDTARPEEANP